MTFDLDTIRESKRRLRQELAALPIGEKLRMLDDLRDRESTIRSHAAVIRSEDSLRREPAGDDRD